MENSEISWTDHTMNPWIGCTKVSPGCANCYAEKSMDQRMQKVEWGPNGTRIVTTDKYWNKLFTLNDNVPESSLPELVFVASLADIFEQWDGPMLTHKRELLLYCPNCRAVAPQLEHAGFYEQGDGYVGCFRCSSVGPVIPATMDHVRRRLLREYVAKTPRLIYMLLTKRPENVLTMLEPEPGEIAQCFDANVAIGVTVEDQVGADKHARHLMSIRQELGLTAFLSCEPLLGPLSLDKYLRHPDGPIVDLVIVGGESQRGARPANADWFRSIRDQCLAAGVAFHFKQWGEWVGGKLFKVGDEFCVDGADGEVYRSISRGKLYSWNEKHNVSLLTGIKNNRPLLDGVAYQTRINEV